MSCKVACLSLRQTQGMCGIRLLSRRSPLHYPTICADGRTGLSWRHKKIFSSGLRYSKWSVHSQYQQRQCKPFLWEWMENDLFLGFLVSFPNEIAHDDPDFYLSLYCSKGAQPKCRVEGRRAVEWPYRRFSLSYRTFSHDVTATIFVPQSNETAVSQTVSQTNPLRVELFSYANYFSCSNKFA